MTNLRTEGIIARSFPFQEYDRIVALFTPTEGLIKLFVKGSHQSKKLNNSRSDALNLVEVIYRQGRNDLHPCNEIEVLNSHSKLRLNLDILETACDIMQAVLSTQYPGKVSSELYYLLLNYFQLLPEMKQPLILSTSFYLKTLRYEGLLNDSTLFDMSADERQLIEILTLCDDASLFIPLTIEKTFADKIKSFFTHSLSTI